MKLYMVFYIAQHVVMVAGPLPYSVEECNARSMQVMLEIAAADPPDFMNGLTSKCEYHALRPIVVDGKELGE